MKYRFEASGDESNKEVTISANSSKVIREVKSLGSATEYNKRHDSIFVAVTLRQGNKVTNCNFNDKKYWRLEKKDEFDAVYKLIVDSTLLSK